MRKISRLLLIVPILIGLSTETSLAVELRSDFSRETRVTFENAKRRLQKFDRAFSEIEMKGADIAKELCVLQFNRIIQFERLHLSNQILYAGIDQVECQSNTGNGETENELSEGSCNAYEASDIDQDLEILKRSFIQSCL